MQKIKTGDLVFVTRGKDRGKKGKVLEVFQQEGRAFVEGINLVKKHTRKRRQDEPGGIVSIEAPVDISNIMYFCRHCNKPSRIGFIFLKDGSKSRICRRCKEVI